MRRGSELGLAAASGRTEMHYVSASTFKDSPFFEGTSAAFSHSKGPVMKDHHTQTVHLTHTLTPHDRKHTQPASLTSITALLHTNRVCNLHANPARLQAYPTSMLPLLDSMFDKHTPHSPCVNGSFGMGTEGVVSNNDGIMLEALPSVLRIHPLTLCDQLLWDGHGGRDLKQ